MKRVPVQSSSVSELGYDPDTMTLEVSFRKGDVYRYFDVPQVLYDELIHSDSVGKFLNSHIKNYYHYTRL
ncbi:MAG TPA: KTSC domain-containing protein [Bacteroidota bacterium]